MKTQTIIVMVLEPKKAPYIRNIAKATLMEEITEIVGGDFESFPIGLQGVYGYCNDEGKLTNLPVNRQVYYGDIIHGNAVLIGFDEEDGLVSLNFMQINEIKKIFMKEEISDQKYIAYLRECGIY